MKAKRALIEERPLQEVNRTFESTPKSTVTVVTRKRHLLALLCIAVSCTILALGLWPFQAPRNGITWLEYRDGLRFGKYSTVMSSEPFQATDPQDNTGASLEIWLQPYRIWDSGTVLAFFRPAATSQFSLQQIQKDLALRTLTQDEGHHRTTATLRVDEVFRKPQPVFITITSGVKGAAIYIDGILAAANPRFPLAAKEFSGRVVLGDSPGQSDSWKGQLFGFAIYHRQLEATEVFHNYAAWKQTGRPEPALNAPNIALYLFNEHSGRVVRNKLQPGVDLYIPEKYRVAGKIVLEPFWTEFSMTRNYWEAALKNIVGFVPFGISFYAYLSTIPKERTVLLTIAMGAALSCTIEILQGFLPTRDSGTTDIITNTLGTWLGAASFRLLAPSLARLARFFPWRP
jgi:hypothetical protein